MSDKIRWQLAAANGVAQITALRDECDELRAEVDRLRKENDILRFKLAASAEPCLYCGLPANRTNECALGFPGCGRADDMLIGGGTTDD